MDSLLYNNRHHDHRSHNKSAPTSYVELSRSDISLLTKILSHAPAHPKSATTALYERIVKQLVSELPSHLRCRLPWLSTLCSLHHKIIPLPIESVLEAFQHEIDVCTLKIWAPVRDRNAFNVEQKVLLTVLEDSSALWLTPEQFESRYYRQQLARPRHPDLCTKCAACVLAKIGGNYKAMVALGAFFIGRTDPGIWKKSKRILWVESWIRNSLDHAQSEDAVLKMWQIGSELRKVRREITSPGDRAYIDRFVEEAHNNGHDHERRESENQVQPPTQDHDSAAEATTPFDQNLTADELFEDQGNPFSGADGDLVRLLPPAGIGDDLGEAQLPYAASSIYSREPEDGGKDVGRPGQRASRVMRGRGYECL